MLMAVKNQLKVTRLSIKYALIKEMLNRATFISNIFFMILNNASFIIQWLILFSIKDSVGGYTFKQVILLWGMAASTFGISHFLFKRSYTLSDTINSGKLDAALVQPKNVLISIITSDVETSALGDILYSFIMLCIFGLSIKTILLFIFFSICGAIMLTCIAVILGSLSFWFNRSDQIADTGNGLMTSFATYPEGIFDGLIKILLYTIVPIGFINYLPVQIMTEFDLNNTLLVLLITLLFILLAFLIFYKGLKRYSSSNLMEART